MSTKVTSTEKISEASPFTTPYLARHVCLGRDRAGYVHHLDRDTATVHRIDPTTGIRVARRPLTERDEPVAEALDSYLRFVAERCGWETRHHYTPADFFEGWA